MCILDPKRREVDMLRLCEGVGLDSHEVPPFLGGAGVWPPVHATETDPAAVTSAMAAGQAVIAEGGSIHDAIRAQAEAAERVAPVRSTAPNPALSNLLNLQPSDFGS
ncbi:hypothetical protein OAO87_04240 [bacterium]|nr:hypothetical protein [bacterium]